jgi:hypothetical protein
MMIRASAIARINIEIATALRVSWRGLDMANLIASIALVPERNNTKDEASLCVLK